MEIETKQEKIWRRFLLGDVTETERARVEDEFLADEEKFVRLEIVEGELIEDYLSGDLTGADKSLFESEFLGTAERRERVNQMKILIDETTARKRAVVAVVLREKSWSETITAFFKGAVWQTACAASVLILLAAFGVWFFNRQNAIQPEIVKTETPIPQPTISVTASPEILVPENSNSANKSNAAPKPSPTVSPEKKPSPPQRTTLAIFVLQPGAIRGGASASRLRVAPQTNEIGLRLKLETNDYQFYTARVTTVDGAIVYTSPRLKSNQKSVLLQLPIRQLQCGDYIVELSGSNAAGQTESVNDYAFTLEK